MDDGLAFGGGFIVSAIVGTGVAAVVFLGVFILGRIFG
jgi:hypothetical protein